MVEVKKIIDFKDLKTETILISTHSIQYLRKIRIKNSDDEIYELNTDNTGKIYIKGFPTQNR